MKKKHLNSAIDPLVIARRVRNKSYDQPTEVGTKSLEKKPIRESLLHYLNVGLPDEFGAWLTGNYPQWEDDYFAVYCLGVSLKAAQKYEPAETCYLNSLKLNSNASPDFKSGVYMELSAIAISRDEYEKAWKLLNKALSITPEDFTVHHNRLCFASLALNRNTREGKRLAWMAYEDMKTHLGEKWFEIKEFVELLQTDMELHSLKEKLPELWREIESAINKKE